MSEESQQNELGRKNREQQRFNDEVMANASVNEVSGQEGVRTFLIECSRKTSNSYLASGDKAPKNTRSSWTNKANGFKIERGDQVSVEAICINSTGAAQNTIEINQKKIDGKDYVGNKVVLEIGFTLSNSGRYACMLPIRMPTGTVKQDVPPTTWVASNLPSTRNNAMTSGFTPILTPSQNTGFMGGTPPAFEPGFLPNANDYANQGGTGIGSEFTWGGINGPQPGGFCMPTSQGWGFSGYSREAKNIDGGYSLFRNKTYPGITGKGGANFTQANPWFVEGPNVTAIATDPTRLAPPTRPINAAALAVAPQGENGQFWASTNASAGNDNLPYIMLRPDNQPFMGGPPGTTMQGGIAGDTGWQPWAVNPVTGRREPPSLEPLTAFVVIDLEDKEYIDVNLLAQKITDAMRQTNNVYRWDKIGDAEHSASSNAHITKKDTCIPYGNKWGAISFGNPVANAQANTWDGIYPSLTGSCYKTIPANLWLGCDMPLSSPNQTSFQENYKGDWLFSGSGVGGGGANVWQGSATYPNINNPDLAVPPVPPSEKVGRKGKYNSTGNNNYIWNNQIYGNMAVRDLDRWQMMYHFFHGDIYNMAYTALGATIGAPYRRMNCKRCVILNSAVKSMVINLPNDSANTSSGSIAGGQAGQNVNTIGGVVVQTPTTFVDYNIHEVSCIGSTEEDPASDDYEGNIIYTNMEYTEYNVKKFAELFPKGEVYGGDLQGFKNQEKNDPRNFFYNLDIGLTNDYATSPFNTCPIKGRSSAATVPPANFVRDESYDASARFGIVTPYGKGVCSSGTNQTGGGDTGFWGAIAGSASPPVYPDEVYRIGQRPVLSDSASPPTTYQDQWATMLDHTACEAPVAPATTGAPTPLDRLHCCPALTLSGMGGGELE